MLQPHQIPTTGRKTTFQVKQLGYSSVSKFAASLPKNAVVVDIGAGLSRLGHEVALQRPDIRWINLDPCYKDPGILKQAQAGAPPGLALLFDDIVQGSTGLTKLKGKVDLVYSYWLLPHLSLETDQPIRAAVERMYDLLKPTGKLVVGPIKHLGFGLISPYRYSGTNTYTLNQPKAAVVTDITAATKLWWLPRLVQLAGDRTGFHVGIYFVGGRLKTK